MHKISYYLEMSRRIRLGPALPKVLNYLRYRVHRKAVAVPCRRYTPQIASLLLTLRCNLQCGYCNAARISARLRSRGQEAEATLETVTRIMDHPLFVRCLLVDLLGGEPLLVPDLGKIVAYLHRRGYLTNTSTNGLLLASRIRELKQAGLTRINVSLYARNRTMLERDLPAINAIFPVHTSLVLMRRTLEHSPETVLETVRFAREAGCLSLRFWMYRPMGISPDPTEVILDSNPAYRDLRRKLESLVPGFCLWPATVKAGQPEKSCAQLWQRAGCTMSGQMLVCCGVEETLEGPEGNLFNTGADDLYNHPVVTEMRKKLLDPAAPPPEACQSCNLLNEPGW